MNFLGYIFAIGSAVCWGMVYTLDQKIVSKISPVSLLFFSYLLSILFLLPLMLFEDNSFKVFFSSGKINLGLVFVSTFLTVVASLLILNSIKLLNASTASILEISYPVFVVLFSYLLYRQLINWQFALGAALVIIGTAIIIRYN